MTEDYLYIHYLPSPEEIAERALATRIMVDWPVWIIELVMREDSPSTYTVIRLVDKYGCKDACSKIDKFSR